MRSDLAGFHLPLGFQIFPFLAQGAKLIQAVVALALQALLAHLVIAGGQSMHAAEEAAGPWVVGRISGATAQDEHTEDAAGQS